MKVLLIDDESDIRRIARLGLERLGRMEVVEADSGAAGVEIAERERPDVILLDVMMPDQDGPATLEQLASRDATRDIPVVFLTAKAMATEVDRLTALGARGVLTKPFDPVQLPAQLRALLDADRPGAE